jgi:hypothetical protein
MDVQLIIDSLTKIVVDIINFIPQLVNGLIILIVGYFLASSVRWLVRFILQRLRFDQLVERNGMSKSLRGIGIQAPLSVLISQVFFALLFLSFLIQGTRLMGLEAVAALLERVLSFLPNFVAATIIFLIGSLIAQFVGNLITTVGAASGLNAAERLGRVMQGLITVFVVILALSQLGIDTSILVTALTIAIAAFGLAFALALGLGARSIVTHILAGYYLRQRLPNGQPVVFDQTTGQVNSIGTINTTIQVNNGQLVVPNTQLAETTLRLTDATSPPVEG